MIISIRAWKRHQLGSDSGTDKTLALNSAPQDKVPQTSLGCLETSYGQILEGRFSEPGLAHAFLKGKGWIGCFPKHLIKVGDKIFQRLKAFFFFFDRSCFLFICTNCIGGHQPMQIVLMVYTSPSLLTLTNRVLYAGVFVGIRAPLGAWL